MTALEWLPNESAVLTGAWGGSVHLSSPTLSPMGILRDLLGHSIIDISASPSSIKVAATAADAHPAIWDINQQAKESSLSGIPYIRLNAYLDRNQPASIEDRRMGLS